VSNKKIHQNSNLAMLEFVARKLEDLKDEFVFVGGCTTTLFITEPIPDVRQTDDVDCIVDVISRRKYYQLEKKLREKGFENGDITCRWHYEDIQLDIMPTNKEILSFSNDWYKPAMENSISHQIADDLSIRVITAPYFLATKLEAFKGRGKNDFLGSHDIEDIVTVIDGRAELLEEIRMSNEKLKKYLAEKISILLEKDDFRFSLAGHLNYYRSTTDSRVQIVLDRLEKIVQIIE